MALLDFLKNKEAAEKANANQPAAKPAVEKAEAKKEKPAAKAKTADASGKFAYGLVKNPHISEKAGLLAEKNQYVFRIDSRANKTEVKKAVEGLYDVDVTSVNVIKVPKKKRRVGRSFGFKKGYAKAVVTVKEGQKIEII